MIKRLTLKILVDNIAGVKDLLAEYGYSLYLECDGCKVLFDTGRGITLTHNAEILETKLEEVDKVVLSHGHNDHTGGLMAFTKKNGRAQVYAHPDIFKKRFVIEEQGLDESGIPFTREQLENKGLNFDLSCEPREIVPGLILSGQIPRKTPMKFPAFVCSSQDGWEEDAILDDQFLLASTAWGTVLILGCTHAGLENTLRYAQELNGGQSIKAVIGGMHLVSDEPEEIEEKLKIFKEMNVEYVVPVHCSGFYAMCRLRDIYGDNFIEGKVGTTISFEENNMKR